MLRPNVGVRAFQGRGATFLILSVPCIPLVMANTHSRKSIGIAHHFALCHCPALLALSLALVAFCFLAPIWGPQLRPEDFRCHHIWDFIFRTMSFQIQTLTINQEVALQWSCSSWVFDLHNFWAWHILQVALHKNQATGGLKQPPLKLRGDMRWENPVRKIQSCEFPMWSHGHPLGRGTMGFGDVTRLANFRRWFFWTWCSAASDARLRWVTMISRHSCYSLCTYLMLFAYINF